MSVVFLLFVIIFRTKIYRESAPEIKQKLKLRVLQQYNGVSSIVFKTGFMETMAKCRVPFASHLQAFQQDFQAGLILVRPNLVVSFARVVNFCRSLSNPPSQCSEPKLIVGNSKQYSGPTYGHTKTIFIPNSIVARSFGTQSAKQEPCENNWMCVLSHGIRHQTTRGPNFLVLQKLF